MSTRERIYCHLGLKQTFLCAHESRERVTDEGNEKKIMIIIIIIIIIIIFYPLFGISFYLIGGL